ncbi:hypothetical protein ETB97_003229 [Aspergillus alliaceus]|uniref:Involucrin repeat protein n=1 Tax=Petromyces alliaceus TaxID=209559 RepID=A0A8H6A1E7_PETAA|nr:hypothetical protein ETB97_003229 [Aspergillus burnettii]
MFKAFLAGGRSSDARSSSSSKSNSRRRTDPKAPSTVSRKPSRGDDRDRGLGDLSAYSSSGNRSKRYAPSAAGDSVASSYTTAELGEFDRNVIERAPKRRDTDDSGRRDRYPDSDGSEDKPRRRRNRARSPSLERTRERDNNTDEVSEGDRENICRERRRTQTGEWHTSQGVIVSGADAPEMESSDHPQFPPPIHNTPPVTSIPGSPNAPGVYDPHVQQQFPGQFPAFVAEPYRPPNPAGEAADYYGDQGQSVAQQPGVRPKPPAVIPNSQAHLMPASPSANPPPEPSSMGQLGAAADYYTDDANLEGQAPEQPNKPPSEPTSKPPRPAIQTTGVPGPATNATTHNGGGSPQEDVGSGAHPLPVEPTVDPTAGTDTQKPPNSHVTGATVGAAAMGAAAGYMLNHHHQSSLGVEHTSQYNNQNYEEASANGVGYVGPSMYPHQPNTPLYPADAEEAGAYAAHPSHPHHAALYHGAPFQSGGLAFQQRQRGPLDRFIDFWRDPEGVGMFEDYTETIGVCKYCFEPGTSSRDAPRKHVYKPQRLSNDRYSTGSRVDKASRYSSSDDESRYRKKTSTKSWLPGMLAGYTVKSLFSNKDFEDTYNVRSGRVPGSSHDSESLSALEQRSRTSRGVYRHSHRRSYENFTTGNHEETRQRSRSTSRSSSRSKKHAALRDAALGAAIGSAAASGNQSRHRSSSRSRSRSPRKTKSRKSSSSDSSFLDTPRPARKFVGGGLSSFFTISSENRKKRPAKKRRSIFSFNNSSSSSLDADLAFGSGYTKRSSDKSKKLSKRKDRRDVDAALLGLGAAATAIAASAHHRSRRTGEMFARKEPKPAHRDYTSPANSDDAWEDVDSGDQSSSSVSSALAFGGSGLFGSHSSQSSESGTSLWGWRWGNRKGKKQKGDKSNAPEGRFPTGAAVATGALGTAALAAGYNREGKIINEDTGSGKGSLRHVAPVPTSDPSRFDAINISSFPSQPALIRPGPIPLQQPQPVTPVSQAVYTSQGETIHSYTAPSGPPSFDSTFARYGYQPQSSRVSPRTHQIPAYPDSEVQPKVSRPPHRSDSSPVFHMESLESALMTSVKRRSTVKDQASVQFDLTREQVEKERRADRLERLKRDTELQEGVQLIDREGEMAPHEDERRSRRYYGEYRDPEYGDREQYGRDLRRDKDSKSWVGAAATGAMGATAAATVLSNSGSSESSQRRHYERSEKRRAERRRISGSDSISSRLPMSERAYEDIDQYPSSTHQEEHIKTSVFRDVSRKKPVYDDYAQFFAPEELRHSSDAHARHEPTSVPTIIEEEFASERGKATEATYPEHRGLPWPVPELKLIEPTPPQSQSGSVRDTTSPTPSAPRVYEDARTSSKRPTTSSRVSWGEHETHEYEVPSTSSEFDPTDQDVVTHQAQVKHIDSEFTGDIPAIPVDSSKGATSDHGADIEFAATVAAATAAAGFGPSLVSDIREKLVSPSETPHGYVEGEAVASDDGARQPLLEKYIENGPLYSEPESVGESNRAAYEVQYPSSIAQEVIRQLTGNKKSDPGESSGTAVEELKDGQQTLGFPDRRAGSELTPGKAFDMPGSFEPEDLFRPQNLHENAQELVQDDSRSSVSASIPHGRQSPTRVEGHRKDSNEFNVTDTATSPTVQEGSTEGKKKRRKRRSKRDSDAFDDSISVTSSPARVEEANDGRRSTEEKAKEKTMGGLLSNLFGPRAPESVTSKRSSSSDNPRSREAQSEVGPRLSEESRRQRRDERRRQKHGGSMDSGTMEREKDRTLSQDRDAQASFLAERPEMPTQVGNNDYEGASGRFSSVDAGLRGLGLNVFEQRPRSRSVSPPASGRTIDLSPKSQSRPTSPELAGSEKENQGQESRRPSGVRPAESPTAVPLHFRRPPSTSPRAHRSLSASSPAMPSPGSPTGRARRPASGEFIKSREMRPLWLVERHGSKVEPQPDEPLPSLPSSKTSSANASAEDLACLQGEKSWEKLDFRQDMRENQQSVDVDVLSTPYHEDKSQHDGVGSEEVTPTAASFGQGSAHPTIRKEKPKYEFHSPSELLQDPSTYAELPSSPTMDALPSVEGSAVDVRNDGRLERNLDSLPPLPVSRPSTPEILQFHASDAAEPRPTQAQAVPDIEAPTLSGSVGTPIAKVVGAGPLDLQQYDKGNSTKSTGADNESDEAPTSHEPASRSLADEAIPVLPDVQLSTTEPENVRKDISARDAKSGFSDIVNVATAAAMGPADEKHEFSDESLHAGVSEEAKAGVDPIADGWRPLQEAQPAQKSIPDVNNLATKNDNEPFEDAKISPKSDPNFSGASDVFLDEGKQNFPVDQSATEESPEPITGNVGRVAEEAVQPPFEELAGDVSSPGLSKKNKKDRRRQHKSVNLNEDSTPPAQDSPATATASPLTPGYVETMHETIAERELSTEQDAAPRGNEISAVEEEPVVDLSNTDEAANTQEPVAETFKSKEKVDVHTFERSLTNEQDPVMQVGDLQNVLDPDSPTDPSKENPVLDPTQSDNSLLTAHTSTTGQIPGSEALETGVTREAQMPEATMIPGQGPVVGTFKTEDAPIVIDANTPEQVAPMHMPRTEEAHEDDVASGKMPDSDAKPASSAGEAPDDTDISRNLKYEKNRRESRGSAGDESVERPSGLGVVTSSEVAPEVSTTQTTKKPQKDTIEDSTSFKEDLPTPKEEISYIAEDSGHPTTKGVESVERLVESSQQDVVQPEKPVEHLAELEEQDKEHLQPELQGSPGEHVPTQEKPPGAVYGSNESSAAVPEQNMGAGSPDIHRSEIGLAANLHEGLSTETSTILPASVDSKPEVAQLEDERHVPEEAEAPTELGSGKVSLEQQQLQGAPAPVDSTTPSLAPMIAEASEQAQRTDVANVETEIFLPRKNSKKKKKKNLRNSATDPGLEKESEDAPPAVASEGVTPLTEAQPTVPPNEGPEARQPGKAQDGKNEVTVNIPSEITREVAADTQIKSEVASSAEMVLTPNLEETPEEQPKKKGKKNKKNRKSISLSDSPAETQPQPPLSAEGLIAEILLSDTSGVVQPTDDTTLQETTAIEEDAIPTAGKEPIALVENPAETNVNPPHMPEHVLSDLVYDPEHEAGETIPAGKNKNDEPSLQSTPDTDLLAAELPSGVEVATTNTSFLAEEPSLIHGQAVDQRENIGNKKPVDIPEAAEDTVSPKPASALTAAQKKKAKKEKKKQRKSVPLNEPSTLEPGVVLSPADDSLERDSNLGKSAPAQEPEDHPASIKEPTDTDKLVNEQSGLETMADTEPNIVSNNGFNEKGQEPAQQEPKDVPGDISDIAATEVADVDLSQAQHTEAAPSILEATRANEEKLNVAAEPAEEQYTVETASVKEEAVSESQDEIEPVDDIANVVPTTNVEATRRQPQGEAFGEKASSEQGKSDEVSTTKVTSQNADGDPAEPFTPKKSKKNKKKKKQQSFSLEEDRPAAIQEETTEEPAGARSDSVDISGQHQCSLFGDDDDAEQPRNVPSEQPVQHSEAKEDEPTTVAEEAEPTRPVEPEPTVDSGTSTSKKKAKKDKKKRKLVSFATNEEDASVQSSKNTEVTESTEQVGEASKSLEPRDEQITEECTLTQTSQEDETEISVVLPEDVSTTTLGSSDSKSTEEVALQDEQATQLYMSPLPGRGAIAPDPMTQAFSAAEELADNATAPQPEDNTKVDTQVSETPKDKEEEPDTGAPAAIGTSDQSEVMSNLKVSIPETPSTQEPTEVLEEVEQEIAPSTSKKDKKKKKRKTQELNESESSVTPEPSAAQTLVQIGEVNQPAAPEVIERVSELDNVTKSPEASSEMPDVSPEPNAEDTQAEAEQAEANLAKEPEGTAEEVREQPQKPQDNSLLGMSAKERRKAKKREKKRQSKSLDTDNATFTAAQEEKAQDHLTNADATSAEDATHDTNETQVSAEIKPSDPSVDATPPAEDDGKENQSHGTESHGENDKNLFWTDHMVSSQVDQQQATPFDSPPQPAPENIEAETGTVSGIVKFAEEIEVGTRDLPLMDEQEATSGVVRISLEQLPAEGFAAKANERGEVPTPDEDELVSQRGITSETRGQDTTGGVRLAQETEGLNKRDEDAATEVPFTAVEIVDDSTSGLQAPNEDMVVLPPAEVGSPQDLRKLSNDSTSEIEELDAAMGSTKKAKNKKDKLRQVHQAENFQREQSTGEHNEEVQAFASSSDRLENAESNLDSIKAPEDVMLRAKDSELQEINVEPATESDGMEKEIATDLVSQPPIIPEEIRKSATEETIAPDTTTESLSETQAQLGNLLPIISNEGDKESTTAFAEVGRAVEKPAEIEKTPALVETVAERFETNERVDLMHVESSGLEPESFAEDREPLQTGIETVREELGHELLKEVAGTAEGEKTAQPLSRKDSKNQKTKAKKQATEASIETSAAAPPSSAREPDAESNPEVTAGPITMAPADESIFVPEEKPMAMPAPQSEPNVPKEAFEVTSATKDEGALILTELPDEGLTEQEIIVERQLHDLLGKEGKGADAQEKLISQAPGEDELGAAEESKGYYMQQGSSVLLPGSLSEEKGRLRQNAESQIAEQTEKPTSDGQTDSIEEAQFDLGARPEEPGGSMTEELKAEDLPPGTPCGRNKKESKEDLGVGEIESVSEEGNVEAPKAQGQFETLTTERSAKDDEWPLIDWEKERVDAIEETPQSSPEVFAAPFEPGIADFDESAIPEGLTRAPDEPAEANKAKSNLGPREDSEAIYATPEANAKTAESVVDISTVSTELDRKPESEATHEHALDDMGSLVNDKLVLEEVNSILQKHNKVSSIFPDLERGAFRRPITTKPSQSVKDGAEDETLDQGANRDAMQVSEAPIATSDGKDNGHNASSFSAQRQSTTATAEGLSEGATIHDLRAPITFQQVEGTHKDPEDAQDTQAETTQTDPPVREPSYVPVPIHEQPSASMRLGRQASAESLSKLRRSPSLHNSCNPSLRPKFLEEDTLIAQASSTAPTSNFGMPSVAEKGAMSPRTPLQPIAEHESLDRNLSGAMVQGRGTPRLEMKPEHVLPRPETPVRKFTDNALARQAWPTLDKDEDQDLRIRKRGSTRSIDREWPTEPIRTPEKSMPILRPSSVDSIRSVHSTHSQRSLRRMDRSTSGDLRAASQAQKGSRQSSCSPQPPVQPPPSDLDIEQIASSSSYDPVTDKGKRPLRAMTDVYEGWGETPSSPRSPSRPPSIRHRRSMQHLQELEARLDQLISENRLLVAARETAEDKLRSASVARRKSDHALNERGADLRDKEAEVEQLKNSVEWLQKEVSRLTEENEGLAATNHNITLAHATEIQTIRASSNRELDDLRLQNQQLSNEIQERVRQEIDAALTQKNAELRRLREDLESARDKVKELQHQIAASMQDNVLVFRDEDYFDAACQKLCGHVQQWVLRFSKHSDLRRCRKLGDIQDEKIADRFENAILDGSDADTYLSDRVRRRDVFMSVVMTMVWEFIFTRYLFGMDREQRQKLKTLEKQLVEVGPRAAVHRWRATTLNLLAKRPTFSRQRENDTEAVALEIFETLSRLLPPPNNVEPQLLESLRKVLRVAVNLSIEMRTQLAEYIMLPPLQPEYDTNGDLARQVYFNASLMNERSGETTSNEELESQHAVVRVVLFPLVVKKGNDAGEGEDEVVVCPAQVLVARPHKKVARMLSGDRMSLDGTRSIHSVAPSSTMDMSNMI